MNIRCETLQDYPSIAQVNILAFGQENEAKLVESIRASDYYIPELALVAEVQDVIVGHILFSYIDLLGAETFKVLGLAPLAVIPQFQNQGIGTQLVKTGLEIAIMKEAALVVVLGHPQLYSRFGFRPSIDYQIEPPFPVPTDVFMVKTLPKYQQKYQGKIIYPAAFNEV
jgi:putative acetyltransferase